MSAAAPLRTLIVDDEPLAVERLEALCAALDTIEPVGSAGDGESALAMIAELEPDLVLLDIAMPGSDGISVARALAQAAHRPAIVFVTAFDGFAVEAFDVGVIDYVLKPVARERLARAVERVIEARGEEARDTDSGGYIREFWVPYRSELIRVAARDIDRIEAERDYMRLHIGSRSYLLHETISTLEERLDPDRFIRVHRSHIVRRDFIAGLRHQGGGVWHAMLGDEDELRIGRKYLSDVKAIAGR